MSSYGGQIGKRPLKKGSGSGSKLGPPDIYPQEARQREDELSSVTLKQGFIYSPITSTEAEYGSARTQHTATLTHSSNSISAFLNAVLSKKDEINTVQDISKKKSYYATKEQFFPASSKSRPSIETFFREQLSVARPQNPPKRIPLYAKKEELFMDLYHLGQISCTRAAWFIKLTANCLSTQPDVKQARKRQTNDPAIEWTQAIIRVLREILGRLADPYRISADSSMPLSLTAPGMDPTKQDPKVYYDQWKYMFGLAQYLTNEGLLDRHEFCSWIVDTVERCRSQADSGLLKLLFPYVLKLLKDIFCSEILTRKLAHSCARYVTSICTPHHQKVIKPSGAMKTTAQLLEEALDCPHHSVTLPMAIGIVQLAVTQCPSACIWNSVTGDRGFSALDGSPLDSLLMQPSQLPSSPSVEVEYPDFKQRIRWMENEIRDRSCQVESRWVNPKIAQDPMVPQVWIVLAALDALDRYSFQKSDNKDNIDSLYLNLFKAVHTADPSTISFKKNIEPLILLTCNWATSPRRSGTHRGPIVAHLLERLHVFILASPALSSQAASESPQQHPLQAILFRFLDNDGPRFETNGLPKHQVSFDNLVLLFTELISRNIFSHDGYLCEIIARNIISRDTVYSTNLSPTKTEAPKRPQPGFMDTSFTMQPSPSTQSVSTPGSAYNPEMPPSSGSMYYQPDEMVRKGHPQSPAAYGYDRRAFQGHQQHQYGDIYPFEDSNSFSAGPSSVEHYDKPASVSSIGSEAAAPQRTPSTQSHHYYYVLNFPIPESDGVENNHDLNQRAVLLFGSSKNREQARQLSKRLGKEIIKLFGKKSCFEISEGRIKMPKIDVPVDYPSLRSRFMALPVFDRKVISNGVVAEMLDCIRKFCMGESAYLPRVETIVFTLDSLDNSLHVTKLISCVLHMLGIVKDVEQQILIRAQGADTLGSVIPIRDIILFCVGVLRKYHPCVIMDTDVAAATFECMRKVVARVAQPSDCCSAERCVLAYMYDLYNCCAPLKTRFVDAFGDPAKKIKSAFMGKGIVSTIAHVWNREHEDSVAELFNMAAMRAVPHHIRSLMDPSWQHVFVFRAIERVSHCDNSIEVNEIACLAAEVTARCSGLTAEWWAAIQALTFAHDRAKTAGYQLLVEKVDVSDPHAHERLSILFCILVARHCMRLEDFIGYVAIRRLMLMNHEPNRGGRLLAHLVLRLLRGNPPPPSEGAHPQSIFFLRYSWDRHLLIAARRNLAVAPLLAVLKALLVLSDLNSGPRDDDFVGVDPGNPSLPFAIEVERLDSFARLVLREICQEDTTRECILKELENLFSSDLILDPILKPEQRRHLVQLLCYPLDTAISLSLERIDESGKQTTQYILRNLDQWNLRVSWVEIMLLQHDGGGHGAISDYFARAVVDAYQMKSLEIVEKASTPAKKSKQQSVVKYELDTGQHVYYLAPLIAKLPAALQKRVLHQTVAVLDVSLGSIKGKEKDRMMKSNILLAHPPFVTMVLSCLDFAKNEQDDLREFLLTSLFNQLTELSKEERTSSAASDLSARAPVLDAIALRLSLVGSLFENVTKDMKILTEWACLLAQLVISGTVEPHASVFITVMDMLMVLVHIAVSTSNEAVFSPTGASTSGVTSVEKAEERKLYSSLVKRIRRDIGEKRGAGIEHVKSLLPLTKKNCTIIVCEPFGMVTDSKGNKTLSVDRRPGLRFSHKLELNPWEVLEGLKNMPALSWHLFNTIKVEKRLFQPEIRARLLTWHSHAPQKAISYYLEAPPIPVITEDEKGDEPTESETTSIETSSPRSPRSARSKTRKNSGSAPTPAAKKRASKVGVGAMLQSPGFVHDIPPQAVPQPNPMWNNFNQNGPGNVPPQGVPPQRFPAFSNQQYPNPMNQAGPGGLRMDIRHSLLNRVQQRAQPNVHMIGAAQQSPTLNHMLNQPTHHRPQMPIQNAPGMGMQPQQRHLPPQHPQHMSMPQQMQQIRQPIMRPSQPQAQMQNPPNFGSGMGYGGEQGNFGHMMPQQDSHMQSHSQAGYPHDYQSQPNPMQQNVGANMHGHGIAGMYGHNPMGGQTNEFMQQQNPQARQFNPTYRQPQPR